MQGNKNQVQYTVQQYAETCIFCQKFLQNQTYQSMIGKALYAKYSSSQNYYYTKDFNDIFNNAPVEKVIHFQDLIVWDESEEFLKRIYYIDEFSYKINLLTDYYKYHSDIPRFFMVPVSKYILRFHEQNRRIQYYKIRKELENNNGNEDKHESEDKSKKDYSNKILLNLESLLKEESSMSQKMYNKNSRLQNNNNQSTKRKMSDSNTIFELNQKLSQIIGTNYEQEISYIVKNECTIEQENNLEQQFNKANEIIQIIQCKKKEDVKQVQVSSQEQQNVQTVKIQFNQDKQQKNFKKSDQITKPFIPQAQNLQNQFKKKKETSNSKKKKNPQQQGIKHPDFYLKQQQFFKQNTQYIKISSEILRKNIENQLQQKDFHLTNKIITQSNEAEFTKQLLATLKKNSKIEISKKGIQTGSQILKTKRIQKQQESQNLMHFKTTISGSVESNNSLTSEQKQIYKTQDAAGKKNLEELIKKSIISQSTKKITTSKPGVKPRSSNLSQQQLEIACKQFKTDRRDNLTKWTILESLKEQNRLKNSQKKRSDKDLLRNRKQNSLNKESYKISNSTNNGQSMNISNTKKLQQSFQQGNAFKIANFFNHKRDTSKHNASTSIYKSQDLTNLVRQSKPRHTRVKSEQLSEDKLFKKSLNQGNSNVNNIKTESNEIIPGQNDQLIKFYQTLENEKTISSYKIQKRKSNSSKKTKSFTRNVDNSQKKDQQSQPSKQQQENLKLRASLQLFSKLKSKQSQKSKEKITNIPQPKKQSPTLQKKEQSKQDSTKISQYYSNQSQKTEGIQEKKKQQEKTIPMTSQQFYNYNNNNIVNIYLNQINNLNKKSSKSEILEEQRKNLFNLKIAEKIKEKKKDNNRVYNKEMN